MFALNAPIAMWEMEKVLLLDTMMGATAEMKEADVTPEVTVVDAEQDTPTTSISEAPTIASSALICKKDDTAMLPNVNDPPLMLTRLPPPMTPSILTCTPSEAPVCVLPFTTSTNTGTPVWVGVGESDG